VPRRGANRASTQLRVTSWSLPQIGDRGEIGPNGPSSVRPTRPALQGLLVSQAFMRLGFGGSVDLLKLRSPLDAGCFHLRRVDFDTLQSRSQAKKFYCTLCGGGGGEGGKLNWSTSARACFSTPSPWWVSRWTIAEVSSSLSHPNQLGFLYPSFACLLRIKPCFYAKDSLDEVRVCERFFFVFFPPHDCDQSMWIVMAWNVKNLRYMGLVSLAEQGTLWVELEQRLELGLQDSVSCLLSWGWFSSSTKDFWRWAM